MSPEQTETIPRCRVVWPAWRADGTDTRRPDRIFGGPSRALIGVEPTQEYSDLVFGPMGDDWGYEVTYANEYTARVMEMSPDRLPDGVCIVMWEVAIKHDGVVVTDTPISNDKQTVGPQNISWLEAVLSAIQATPPRDGKPIVRSQHQS